MVPERFSSEYVRMVIIGITKRMITAELRSTPRIICWLMLAAPPPNCIICSLCCTNTIRYM